jgi:hypothetical protein
VTSTATPMPAPPSRPGSNPLINVNAGVIIGGSPPPTPAPMPPQHR